MKVCRFKVPGEVSVETVKTFLRLYQFETWLRELVYVELKANLGDKWWTVAEMMLRQSGRGGIPASKSRAKDKRHPHMATAETDPIWFLSFESLLKIVFHRKFWGYFKSFLTTKTLLRAKFDEIAPIRNRIAHCRSLHKDDLDRVESLMRDLDHGMWNFCTSYNHKWFVGKNSGAHPLAELLRAWERSAQPWRSSVVVDLKYAIVSPGGMIGRRRPPRRGAIYHVTFYLGPESRRFMNYREILRSTRHLHQHVVHIMLDSFQASLSVTIPSLLEPDAIMDMIEDFQSACANFSTAVPPAHFKGPVVKSRRQPESPPDYELFARPLELIASEWPHYVIPPTNPLAFLTPDCPCSFFSVTA